MQSSPYAQAVPSIVAAMKEEREDIDEQQQPDQENAGEAEQVLYVYRTEQGGLYVTPTKVAQEPPPQPPQPSPIPVIVSIVALFFLLAVGTLSTYQQTEVQETVRVPAILLPVRTFTASIKITPTGVKTHPAITAHGTLTITNGSILSEELPKGLILTGEDGVEIVTDSSVFVPPGSATSLGYATVAAHAVIPGAAGNIHTLDIDSVEGTALYIRNLQPFTGGQDAYTTRFITPSDRATALAAARTRLTPHTTSGILLRPCAETVTGNQIVTVIWHCQFVTYHLPTYMHVTRVRVIGTSLFVDVFFVVRPRPFPGK